MESRIVWPLAAQLGEGPLWVAEDAALWFVDIKGHAIHRFDPVTGTGTSHPVDGPASFLVLAADGGLLVGIRGHLHRFRDGILSPAIAAVDMPAHNRTNDATVDARGRLWFGTMDDNETLATGAVHVFDGRDIRAVGGECVITNGPATSPDGRWLYHVDTLGRTVTRFDISDSDLLTDGELFIAIEDEAGYPDGVSVDAEGCVWVALWGGWGVRRYAPDGTLLATVALPVPNVTKVAFGGQDLRTAYATTAWKGLSDEDRIAAPLAGGLFAFDAPAPGLPAHAVRVPA